MKPNLPSFSINCRGKILSLENPKIMGILNLTPDSFSDGGQFFNLENALNQVEKMILEGADIIDIGAQSTRPNAQLLTAKQEIERLGNVILTIKKEFPDIIVSLDSFYAEVVQFGADQGIDLVNDISGGQFDDKMLPTVAQLSLPYILMHINPNYSTMHDKNVQGDITLELNQYFSKKIPSLYTLGIKDIILDPGFGFGKTLEQNYQLLEELPFLNFGHSPILVGISRKSFIYKPLGKLPTEIVKETQKLHLKALQKGARILRVHDVAATKTTIEKFLSY